MSTDEKETLDLTPQKPPMDDLMRVAFENIMAQREEVLRAFIAKHGLLPDKVEQIIEKRGNKIRWYLRRCRCVR